MAHPTLNHPGLKRFQQHKQEKKNGWLLSQQILKVIAANGGNISKEKAIAIAKAQLKETRF